LIIEAILLVELYFVVIILMLKLALKKLSTWVWKI